MGQHTVLVPFVGSVEVGLTINPSSQVYIRSVNTLETDVVNTVDDNDRITFNFNSVRSNRNSLTTRHTVVDESLIDIMCRILIDDGELFVEVRTINQRHQETILIPNIGQRRVNVIFTGNRIVQISGNKNLSAFANILGKVSIVDNKNVVDLRRSDNDHRVITEGSTLGSGLGDLNEDLSRRRQREGHTGGSTVRNGSSVTIDNSVPLINDIAHVVVTEMSRSGNLAVRTNRVIVNRNSYSRILANIQVERIAGSDTTIIVGNRNRNDIRIVLSSKLISEESRSGSDNNLSINFTSSGNIIDIREFTNQRTERIVINSPIIVKEGIITRTSGIIQIGQQHNKVGVANNSVTHNLDGRIV